MTEPLLLYRPGERRKAAPREYIIGELLGRAEAMLLLGAPKAGKSALAVSMATSVALAQDFLGRRVSHGAVVYVAAERFAESDLRLQIALGDQVRDAPLRLSSAKLLTNDDETSRLAAAIVGLAKTLKLRPALVVFDVVNAFLRDVGADENSARDIGKLTTCFDQIREVTGAAIVVVHHSKRDEKRSRGSDALEGWADTVAMVDGAKGAVRRLSVLRSNTLDAGLKATFELRSIELGTDEATGATSGVVVAKPTEPSVKVDNTADRLLSAPDVNTVFSAVQNLASTNDVVTVNEWRAASMRAFSNKTAGAARQAFSAGKKKLGDAGLVTIVGDNVSVSALSEGRQLQ